METTGNVQQKAMRHYRSLVNSREDWAGALVLCSGVGCAASGIPVAASVAGAATLAIDADGEALKSALRRGELDFVVNTLDEALRTLKNEVRQKRPLSVGLIADVPTMLAELASRGVKPDMVVDAHSVSAPRKDELFIAVRDAGELRQLDATLLEVLPAEDARKRWILRLPQYLREARSGGRWIWLSSEERTAVATSGFSPE